MVDGSGHLVATMVLLVHLGQLKISYGPLQFQECRSLTSYVVQGVDPFSEFFFFICLVLIVCVTLIEIFFLNMLYTVYNKLCVLIWPYLSL